MTAFRGEIRQDQRAHLLETFLNVPLGNLTLFVARLAIIEPVALDYPDIGCEHGQLSLRNAEQFELAQSREDAFNKGVSLSRERDKLFMHLPLRHRPVDMIAEEKAILPYQAKSLPL